MMDFSSFALHLNNVKVKAVFVFIVLFGFGMVACQSGNDLGVQLMSGDGQDLGKFSKGEKIVIPGLLSNATDSTRLLFAINLSPLRLLVSPSSESSAASRDFTIEINDQDVFLIEGTNELVIMRLDGKQQAEQRLSFEVE